MFNDILLYAFISGDFRPINLELFYGIHFLVALALLQRAREATMHPQSCNNVLVFPVLLCSALTLLDHFLMKVICAWCENEGKETLIGEISLYDWEVTSHGICIDHEKVMLKQIEELKIQQNQKLRRPRRRPRTRVRVSKPSSVPPALLICTTAWRRRRNKHRISAAQLSLPFGDT